MDNKKVIVMMISFSLILLIGGSYAYLKVEKGNSKYVINVGTLKVIFDKEKENQLTLNNAVPMTDSEGINQENEINFTIKNTGNVGAYYDIYIEELSTSPEFKSVIRYISKKDGNNYTIPETLSEDKYIAAGEYIKDGASVNYKIKIWLEEKADNTYMNKEFKGKVVINSFQESNYAKDVIKSKLVKYSESSKNDFTGGLVAVNTDGELYNETIPTQEIREYRYSGLNVKNYVKFNNELWRIVGVFKDEFGEENIKIVRNSVLNTKTLPISYKINNKTYKINAENSRNTYWNYETGTESDKNDWSVAGLQYYLNTFNDDENVSGYLSSLSSTSIQMIANKKYYLGISNFGIRLKDAYIGERKNTVCSPDVVNPYSSNCFVWFGNNATWTGKIGLLYPSDLGYSANSTYWSTSVLNKYSDGAKDTTWMYKTLDFQPTPVLFISPSHVYTYYVVNLRGTDGGVGAYYVYYNSTGGSLPTLYLKSNVKITLGSGEESNPYQLELSE